MAAAVSVVLLLGLVVASFWDVRDTGWGSWFVPVTALSALVAGIGAGAGAVAAMLRGERWVLLFLPTLLGIFSVLVLVGEAFVWE